MAPISPSSFRCCKYFGTDPVWRNLVFNLGCAANFLFRISEATASFSTVGRLGEQPGGKSNCFCFRGPRRGEVSKLEKEDILTGYAETFKSQASFPRG